MNKLILLMALTSSGAIADGNVYGYQQQTYDTSQYYRPQVIQIDPVQQRFMQLQQDRGYKLQEDTAVRQGLKDAWRGDGGSASGRH